MIFNLKKKLDLKYRIHIIPKGFLEPNRVIRSLIIQQEWDDDFIKIIKEQNIESINYNAYAKTDIEFLEKLSNFPIRNFILQTSEVKDITPLRHLLHLECLCLDTNFTAAPDFSKFVNLWWVGLTWRAKAKSLLESKSIRRLGLTKHPFETLEPLSKMTQLESLSLRSTKMKSLKGIENFPNLEHLSFLYCPNLESLEGLQHCPKLVKEETIITKCRHITPDNPLADYVTFDDLV